MAAVGPATIKKELATLRMLLNHALVGQAPPDTRELFRALPFPKRAEAEGFLTWAEIEARLTPRTRPPPCGSGCS